MPKSRLILCALLTCALTLAAVAAGAQDEAPGSLLAFRDACVELEIIPADTPVQTLLAPELEEGLAVGPGIALYWVENPEGGFAYVELYLMLADLPDDIPMDRLLARFLMAADGVPQEMADALALLLTRTAVSDEDGNAMEAVVATNARSYAYSCGLTEAVVSLRIEAR